MPSATHQLVLSEHAENVRIVTLYRHQRQTSQAARVRANRLCIVRVQVAGHYLRVKSSRRWYWREPPQVADRLYCVQVADVVREDSVLPPQQAEVFFS